jgi:hypothetical protein
VGCNGAGIKPSQSCVDGPSSSLTHRSTACCALPLSLVIYFLSRFAEHRPTFTTGRRDSLPASLARVQSEQARLAHAGADWAVTRRGGMVTYHGPGQLVGYLLFDLEGMDVSLLFRLTSRGRRCRRRGSIADARLAFLLLPSSGLVIFLYSSERDVSSTGCSLRSLLTLRIRRVAPRYSLLIRMTMLGSFRPSIPRYTLILHGLRLAPPTGRAHRQKGSHHTLNSLQLS